MPTQSSPLSTVLLGPKHQYSKLKACGPQTHTLNSTSQSDDIRRWDLWEMVSSSEWSPEQWDYCSSKNDAVRRQLSTAQQREGPHRTQSCGTLISDFQSPEL